MDKRLVLIFLATSSVFLLSGCPNTDDAPVSGKNVVEFTVEKNESFDFEGFHSGVGYRVTTDKSDEKPGFWKYEPAFPWTEKVEIGEKRPLYLRLNALTIKAGKEGIKEKDGSPFTVNIKVDGKPVELKITERLISALNSKSVFATYELTE